MILYTPVAIEEVLAGMSEPTEREYIEYKGQMFYAVKTEDGAYKIDQLLSTNPTDFVNPDFLPGTIFNK